MSDKQEDVTFAPALADGMPLAAFGQLQRERDHLLLLHEALGDVERAPTLEARLDVFVQAIRRIGFGRVTITLRDADFNAITVVTAGLTAEEDRLLREMPVVGEVWRRRFSLIERFRISNSYYLEGRDPWVMQEFAGGVPSALEASDDPTWSPRDILFVPLRSARGALVATLVLDDPTDRARPSLTRVRTVELFAQQVAAMLEQASLVELAEGRARRLQQLHAAGTELAGSLDEPTVLAALAQQVELVILLGTVIVFATDVSGAILPRVLRREGTTEEEIFTPAALTSLASAAALGRRPVRQASGYAVPCVSGSTTVAVIVAEPSGGRPLDADDADLLQTLAAQAASAISNARLYAESLRQRRQTEALADVARAVGESLSVERVMHLILGHATALLRTQGATLSLLRGDSLEVTAGVGAGAALIGTRLPLHGSISGRAIRTASSIIRDDVREDADTFARSVAAQDVRNAILVPLLSVQGPIGVLSVFNRVNAFTDDDADILQRLADQVAVAIVNARLFEEVAEATREWAVAFDSIGSGMVLLDRSGRIQRTNAQARALMGGATNEIFLGRQFHEALFGDDALCEQCVHITAIVEGTVKRGTHDDRTRGRVFEITAAPHPLGGAVVTFDDVTAHRSLAERYRLVVETSRDAIVITDRDRRLIFANPAAHHLLARGDDLIGIPGERAVPEDERALVRQHEDLALAGEPQNYEGVVLRPDGERRLVAIATAPLRELGVVTGIVASLRDITDERRARHAVALSEERYRNLFESASDAIYTLDVHGSFTSANQATCELTGRTRDALLAHESFPVLDERAPSVVAAQFQRAVQGRAVRYECHLRRPDGERRALSVTITPIRRGTGIIGVLGVARDITEARARVAALARSESRYARLVESASDAIFTVDGEGRFTAVNRALEHAVGRGRDSLLSARFTDLVVERDLAAAERLLRETYGGEQSRGAVGYRSARGDVRQGSLITSPIVEDEKIVGALGIMRDVTDEQRLADQLLQQEKLVAVGQLVSGVAHELNNPLAGVMAFAQLLLASPAALDRDGREAVATIHREARRAAKIVSSLLTSARQQPAERLATRLNDIVRDTLELRRYALRTAGIEINVALDPALPTTWADGFQLQQVVLNLIANAEQALAGTSDPRIGIRTELANGGDTIVVAVSDNGPGIAPEQLDRIFNPFFTTKPVGQGTGLGLSISDGIIREHGGRIRVESVPGAGATFFVELPHLPPPERELASTTHRRETGVVARRVLVVDDEPALRAAVSGFLSSLGHEVSVAHNGAEARALLAASEYDVVLLDLRMPVLGGEALYRELRTYDERHAGRVVFVTGDLQRDSAQEFLREAGRPVIGKPFELDDLAAVIATVTP